MVNISFNHLYLFLSIFEHVTIIPMKKAIILAAGIGKRLGDLTSDLPKCLLPIDSDNVLIDYSLHALKDNGVNEISFVSGFCEDKLKKHIAKKWKNKFIFKFIFNEKYAQYNNVYSAYLAKNIWNDETVLLNSDIIFHPGILKNDVPLRSFLVIDDQKKLIAEDMKVRINEKGEIKEINKNLNIKTSFGEYIGITYLRGKERVKFLESLEQNVKNKNLHIYYEDALADVLSEISVFPCSTNSLPWTEVDTKEDYEVAKRIAKEIMVNI